VVSVADRLDSIVRLVEAGEAPSGSRDPFGLRRAANAVFRVVEEKTWPLSLGALVALSGGSAHAAGFLRDRYALYLRDRGFTTNEILAVLKPRVSEDECLQWPLHDVVSRLEAIRPLRGRADFENLVDLTKRVDNILTKGADEIRAAESGAPWAETEPAARALEDLAEECAPLLERSAAGRDYRQAVEVISRFIAPVERFFAEVLVLDPKNPAATRHRARLLSERLKPLLTSTFDIRELAGQADRKS
jgi:glycyl-tRNA synthetase beta chain